MKAGNESQNQRVPHMYLKCNATKKVGRNMRETRGKQQRHAILRLTQEPRSARNIDCLYLIPSLL